MHRNHLYILYREISISNVKEKGLAKVPSYVGYRMFRGKRKGAKSLVRIGCKMN